MGSPRLFCCPGHSFTLVLEFCRKWIWAHAQRFTLCNCERSILAIRSRVLTFYRKMWTCCTLSFTRLRSMWSVLNFKPGMRRQKQRGKKTMTGTWRTAWRSTLLSVTAKSSVHWNALKMMMQVRPLRLQFRRSLRFVQYCFPQPSDWGKQIISQRLTNFWNEKRILD